MTQKPPSYRKHKPSGQAVVTLNGRTFYLGPYGTKVSRTEYDRLVGEWLAGGRTLATSTAAADGYTIVELVSAYLRFAHAYYVKNGRPTKELPNVKLAVRLLRQLYGRTPVADFGPLALKALRVRMIELGWSRGYVNTQIGRVKRIFKWGTENELVPVAVHQALQTVAGLRRGRSEARETDPVRPVADTHVDAIRPHVSRQVWAMIELQRLTGMRPGEVTAMRGCDVNMDGRLWVYVPAEHKTEHHGRAREIYLGPNAQKIVNEFLRPDTEAYLFSPMDAERERRAALHRKRRTPLSCGNRPGTNKKRRPRWAPKQRYTPDSYRRAITRGCDLAFPPPADLAADVDAVRQWRKDHRWHLHQLRHTAATRLRKEFGLEAARVVLGHGSAAVTEIYAEVNKAEASRLFARLTKTNPDRSRIGKLIKQGRLPDIDGKTTKEAVVSVAAEIVKKQFDRAIAKSTTQRGTGRYLCPNCGYRTNERPLGANKMCRSCFAERILSVDNDATL